jgi:hypothetical protein
MSSHLLFFSGLEFIIFLLPALFVFRNLRDFSICLRYFIVQGNPHDLRISLPRQRKSLRFAYYFVIVLILTAANIQFLLF